MPGVVCRYFAGVPVAVGLWLARQLWRQTIQQQVQPSMPGIDLKWSLMVRVVLVALVCFLAGAGMAVYRAHNDAIEANRLAGETIGNHLDLQLLRIDSALDLPQRFPDWDAILTHTIGPGQCIQYIGIGNKVGLSSCMGSSTGGNEAPAWFVALFRPGLTFDTNFERPITYRNTMHGKVVVSSDPAAVTLRAWTDICRMLGLSALTIAALCVLVYFVIDRALRPTKDVLNGLNRLAAGDLSCRLPEFRLIELQRISEVFNGLANTLETTIAERAGLARRLVDAQEQERRHLARELHDELAQSLTAMSATATSIKATAMTECPALVPEAQSLAQTASAIMKVLRRTLRALRPQEIDELGLITSLEVLVADYNGRSAGVTKFRLEVQGDPRALSPTIEVHIYRILQEGLTNAAKHAHAANVKAILTIEPRTVEIRVEDDGEGSNHAKGPVTGFGLGLIGIRERVLALEGTMSIGPAAQNGLVLRVKIPNRSASEITS